MQNAKLLAVAASAAAFVSLTACNSEPEVVTANAPDPQAEALANAAPVELPPAIAASRTFRCKDNSLVYADFYTNDTVKVRADRSEPGTVLTRGEDGGAYTAEGYSVSDNAESITYSAPGKGSQACNA